MKKWWVWLIIVAVVAIGIFAVNGNRGKQRAQDDQGKIVVVMNAGPKKERRWQSRG